MDQPEWFNKLKAWLGIKDSIRVLNCDSRGCYSLYPIKQYEPIIKIKSKYLIEYSQIQSKYKYTGDLEFANSLVAFFLMEQDQDPCSPIRPYLDSLPTSTDEFHLTDSEQTQMKGLVNGFNYLQHLESLESDCLALYIWNLDSKYIQFNGSDNFEQFYSRYIHYRHLVGSRIFGYERDGQLQSGLVPYIDMFNHSFEPNAMWEYDPEIDSFVLRSLCAIKAGDEILDHYGFQTNYNLFVYYGFVCKYNLYTSFEIDEQQINMETSIQEINSDSIKTIATEYLESHINKINKITNPNILQIYLDEIKLLKQILKFKINNYRIMI